MHHNVLFYFFSCMHCEIFWVPTKSIVLESENLLREHSFVTLIVLVLAILIELITESFSIL